MEENPITNWALTGLGGAVNIVSNMLDHRLKLTDSQMQSMDVAITSLIDAYFAFQILRGDAGNKAPTKLHAMMKEAAQEPPPQTETSLLGGSGDC